MELWQRFTVRARRSILKAHNAATQVDSPEITSEHLLLGLLGVKGSGARDLLEELGVDLDGLQAHAMAHSGPVPGEGSPDEIRFTANAQRVLQLAYSCARDLKHAHIGTEHVLLGVADPGCASEASRVLTEHGVTRDQLWEALERGAREPYQAQEGARVGEALRGGERHLTPAAEQVLHLAREQSEQLGDEYVGTEHLLLAMLALDDCVARRLLAAQGIDVDRIREAISLGEGRRPADSDEQ